MTATTDSTQGAAGAEALPAFRFALEAQTAKVTAGGSAREVTVRELPISEQLAGVSMWLEPGAVRELHWHANAAEWGYVVAGNLRVTAFDPEQRLDIGDVGPGDVFFFPRGHGHAIQNAGTVDSHVVLIFDNGQFSEFATFSSTDWLAHTPPEVLAKDLGVPVDALAGLPTGEAYIVAGPVPPPLGQDRPATLQPPAPLAHGYPFSAQPVSAFAGGTIKIVDSRQFPLSATISGALMTLQPGGLRELHWHPCSAEWFYVLAGTMRMTLFGSQGRARTETFAPGDVGYVPMGYGHYLENVGDGECSILLGFNNGVYKQIGLSGWLAANPRQLVATNFALPLAVADRFPDSTRLIAPGNAPPTGE